MVSDGARSVGSKRRRLTTEVAAPGLRASARFAFARICLISRSFGAGACLQSWVLPQQGGRHRVACWLVLSQSTVVSRTSLSPRPPNFNVVLEFVSEVRAGRDGDNVEIGGGGLRASQASCCANKWFGQRWTASRALVFPRSRKDWQAVDALGSRRLTRWLLIWATSLSLKLRSWLAPL